MDSKDAQVLGAEETRVESARRQRTRSRIMAAAYETFAEHGVRAASVEMIVEHAGFTRGAFYSNFASKEELFLSLQHQKNQERFDRLQRGFDAILPELAPGDGMASSAAIEPIILAFIELEPDDRKWLLIEGEFRMLAMRDPDVARQYLAQQSAYVEQFADFIDGMSSLAGLRFIVPVEAVARIIGALYDSAVEHAILSAEPFDDGPARAQTMRTLATTIDALIVSR